MKKKSSAGAPQAGCPSRGGMTGSSTGGSARAGSAKYGWPTTTTPAPPAVFKFCFDAERLRSFKRELTLFRLLREELGDRHDIARLYEVRLNEPPFYLETEYTKDGSLEDWAAAQGGIEQVPLEDRLALVARVADAVAAAHSVGVLHKDIKPANILIYRNEDGKPMPQLSDFGIGTLTEHGKQLTQEDLTSTAFSTFDDSIVMTGTPMYTPPDALAGKRYTIHGDIYALGVLLYQMVVGDLDEPLGQGWERDVEDPLIRRDISACVAAHEDARLHSAKELAERIRTLPERRRVELRRRLRRLVSMAAVLLVVLVALLSGLFIYERGLRHEAERQRDRAEANKNFFVKNFIQQADPSKRGRGSFGETGPNRTIAAGLIEARTQADVVFADDPEIRAEVLLTIAESFKNLSMIDRAEEAARESLRIRSEEIAENPEYISQSQFELANVLWFKQRNARNSADQVRYLNEALTLAERSLEIRRTVPGEHSKEFAESLNTFATCLTSLGRHQEAEANYRRVLSIRRALFAADPATYDGILIPAVMNNLANCLRAQDRDKEAQPMFEEAIEAAREVGGEHHLYVGLGLANLARLLDENKRPSEAESRLAEAIGVYRQAPGGWRQKSRQR